MNTDPRIEAAAQAFRAEFPTLNNGIEAYRRQMGRWFAAATENAATIATVEELDALPPGSAVLLKDGTVRLRTEWSSGWASGQAGDDYPTWSDLPARVIHWGTA